MLDYKLPGAYAVKSSIGAEPIAAPRAKFVGELLNVYLFVQCSTLVGFGTKNVYKHVIGRLTWHILSE